MPTIRGHHTALSTSSTAVHNQLRQLDAERTVSLNDILTQVAAVETWLME